MNVVGNTNITGDLDLGANVAFKKAGTFITNAFGYLVVDGAALYLRANAGQNVFIADDTNANVQMVTGGGSVGIGTTAPTHKLNVLGTSNFTGVSRFENGISAIGIINATTDVCIIGGNCLSTVSGGSGSLWGTNGTNLFNSTANWVGIGLTNPMARLHVLGLDGSTDTAAPLVLNITGGFGGVEGGGVTPGAGGSLFLSGGKGANSSGVFVEGGKGGSITLVGGRGGDGDISGFSGAGGDINLVPGNIGSGLTLLSRPGIVNITGNTTIYGKLTMGNTCGIPGGMITAERGSIVSNTSMSFGNGVQSYGSPQPCSGTINAIGCQCTTASAGNQASFTARKNNALTSCTTPIVNVSNTAYYTTGCGVAFSAGDIIAPYADTETGTLANCVCTVYVGFN